MIILYAYIQIIDNIVQWQLSHLSERGASRGGAYYTLLSRLTGESQADTAHISKLDWSLVTMARGLEIHRFL